MSSVIEQHKNELTALCKTYKVNNLFAFASVTTAQFSEHSDIDLVVQFNVDEIDNYADNYYNFKYSLQNLFNREIDLLEGSAIKKHFSKSMHSQTNR